MPTFGACLKYPMMRYSIRSSCLVHFLALSITLVAATPRSNLVPLYSHINMPPQLDAVSSQWGIWSGTFSDSSSNSGISYSRRTSISSTTLGDYPTSDGMCSNLELSVSATTSSSVNFCWGVIFSFDNEVSSDVFINCTYFFARYLLKRLWSLLVFKSYV